MRRASLTAAAVVAEAAALADEGGLSGVTLSAVARRLAVQTPSLYSHVRDLAALLDGVTALALDELASGLSLAIAGRSGRGALDGFATAHRTFAHEHPGLWQALQRRAGDDVARSEAAQRVGALTLAVLHGYPVPAHDRVAAVRVLGGAVNGYLALERIGSFDHSAPSPEETWRTTIAALDAMLHAWPSE